MNVKLFTPKTLKAGSGMSSVKQFLLALLATTVSIVLTFGTAAVIDNHKKNAARKEMVKMVIYDFDKTIEQLEWADTVLVDAMRKQHDIALHPEHFDSLRFKFSTAMELLQVDFPETTERIFSTSIETFNTIGDVNFVNEVSSFYLARHKYKEMLLDEFSKDAEQNPVALSRESLLAVSFPDYALTNRDFLTKMKRYRNECMRMMNVSEEDMSEFSKRQTDEKADPESDAQNHELMQEYEDYVGALNQAKEKL